jgi:hypothetical protein
VIVFGLGLSPDSSENPFMPVFGTKDYLTILLFFVEFSELRLKRIAGIAPEKSNRQQ